MSTTHLVEKYGLSNLMALRIDDSMNKIIPNQGVAIIHKTEDYKNGDCVAVIINGWSGTLKTIQKTGSIIRLIPESYNSMHQPLQYDLTDDDTPQIVIIGVLRIRYLARGLTTAQMGVHTCWRNHVKSLLGD